MIKFLKQLFCNHIYKCKKEEFLGKFWELIDTSIIINSYKHAYYNRYADYMICVKCGKTKIISKRKLLI